MSQLRVLHFPALHSRWQLRLETQVIRFFQDEAQPGRFRFRVCGWHFATLDRFASLASPCFT